MSNFKKPLYTYKTTLPYKKQQVYQDAIGRIVDEHGVFTTSEKKPWKVRKLTQKELLAIYRV